MTIASSRPRDPRLDFFRGLAMFIILLAHTPGNPWTLWIPARFGFSDATEIFVFSSGMASALAFGGVFERQGWGLGTARIGFRVWQVYWAHIATFFVIAMAMVAVNAAGIGTRDYVGQLNLWPFFNNPTENLLGLMTLSYVPNYFDILPMYLVILAMVPLVMALARVSVAAMVAAVLTLWAATNLAGAVEAGATALQPLADALWFLHLPAQYFFEPPHDTREWFFNPFAWQLVFFTGFAFMRGWIAPPPVRWWLVALALAAVLITVPFAWYRVIREVAWIDAWRDDWGVLFSKTNFGVLRYVHFLALAYVAWVCAGPHGAWLSLGRVWTAVVGVVRKVGQQSLAVFVTSLVVARFLGLAFDVWGKGFWSVILINAVGFAVLIATAYTVAWFKGSPWRLPPKPAPAPPGAPSASPAKAADPAARMPEGRTA
ncbi:OpgC domain-containing protein [Rhodobacteraceae bacterium 2CG4]|uniref:OpgC domain-containing protein n=1 Tax=Halovulum marinum TaxID=2662447 RepID=A0A6L5Z009_9RHOB|nr:OpgC domain-containing protein [Halovulum marinum]MSU89452.1 OpgC domain-containing protein [Halovulum marinum]